MRYERQEVRKLVPAIRYGAARGWVDAIIQPHETREVLIQLLQYVSRSMPEARFHTGVIQV